MTPARQPTPPTRTDLLIHDGHGRILLDRQPDRQPALPHTHAPSPTDVTERARDAACRLSAQSPTGRVLTSQPEPSRPGHPPILIVDGGQLSTDAIHRIDRQPEHHLTLSGIGAACRVLPAGKATQLRHAARAWLLGSTGDSHPPASAKTPSPARYVWHGHEAVPREIPIRQVWGWLTTPDRQLLVIVDHRGVASLPGGHPEHHDQDHDETLRREAAEEAQVTLGPTTYLGWQEVTEPGKDPYAQLRIAAPLADIHPRAPDPDTGIWYRRLLIPLDYANFILAWGPEGDAQTTAAAKAAPRLGIPGARTRFCVQEL